MLWEAGGFCRFNRNAPMPDCREPGRSGGPWSASWQWPPAGSKGGRAEGAGAGDPVASYLPLPRLASANSGAYTAVQGHRAELLASLGLDLPSMVREPLQPRPAAAAAFTQLAAAASARR